MIKLYDSGQSFINDNKEYLETNINLSSFFFLDAPLIDKCDKINYALKCVNNDKELLVLKVEPYNLMLFGCSECCNEVFDFLVNNDFEIKNILCEENVGKEVIKSLMTKNINYNISITMDFMECDKITIPTDLDVQKATILDIDKLYEFNINFVKDCGLFDEVKKEDIIKTIDKFRFIKFNGKIVSMAKYANTYSKYARITCVYTLDEYRGMGFAKKVVNALKNEMINDGFIATLNVDRLNPISNHIYSSIGFNKTFSQVILVKKS